MGGGQLYVLSEANISAIEDKMTLQTLSGVLARESPRIYTIKSFSPAITNTSADDDFTVFWLNDLQENYDIQLNFTYLHDYYGLLREFKDQIRGYVVYERSTGSTNSALIRCAAEEGTISAGTPSMISFLSSSLGLKMIANVTNTKP